jgi:hypothetical protein
MRKPLLSPEEQDLVKKLGECFSDFTKLPVLHPADEDEFMRAIHAAQNIVLARPAFLDVNKLLERGDSSP